MWVISGGLNFSSKKKKKDLNYLQKLPIFLFIFLGINRLLFSLSLFFPFSNVKLLKIKTPTSSHYKNKSDIWPVSLINASSYFLT